MVPASQSASFATLAPAPFASHSFETSRRLPRLPLPLSKCRSPPGDPRACPCCCCCRVDLSPFFASFRYSHLGSFQKSRLETVVEPDQTPSSVGYSSDGSPPHSPGKPFAPAPSPPRDVFRQVKAIASSTSGTRARPRRHPSAWAAAQSRPSTNLRSKGHLAVARRVLKSHQICGSFERCSVYSSKTVLNPRIRMR